MNREEAKKARFYMTHNEKLGGLVASDEAYKNGIDKIYDYFEELKKENIRLKKQLANNHHMECMCSFCKPPISCCYIENE